MKAIVQDRYGSPDVLQLKDVDTPVAADNQVLVRVHAAAVNARDWHEMRGTRTWRGSCHPRGGSPDRRQRSGAPTSPVGWKRLAGTSGSAATPQCRSGSSAGAGPRRLNPDSQRLRCRRLCAGSSSACVFGTADALEPGGVVGCGCFARRQPLRRWGRGDVSWWWSFVQLGDLPAGRSRVRAVQWLSQAVSSSAGARARAGGVNMASYSAK